MPKQNRNSRPRRKAPSSRGKRSGRKGGIFFLRWLSQIPLWGYILGGIGIVLLYCFILFHFFVDPYSFQWKAIYGEPTYPEGYAVRGIDVSHYQEDINYLKLRNANMNTDPVSFVIVKATEGNSMIDSYFNHNFYQTRQNDFVRGAYHFMTPDCTAQSQARFYIRQVNLESGDLPPVLDIEDHKKWASAGKSPKEIQQMAKQWLDIVEKHYGVTPIIYTSYKFRTDILTDTIFNRYPYWMAHYYVDKPRTDVKWTFWQHTDCGRVDGVSGLVDCNIFNGSRAELDSLLLP